MLYGDQICSTSDQHTNSMKTHCCRFDSQLNLLLNLHIILMKLYLQKEIRFVFDSSYVILKNLLWYENYLYYDLIVMLIAGHIT